jgi:hypothetical protein
MIFAALALVDLALCCPRERPDQLKIKLMCLVNTADDMVETR